MIASQLLDMRQAERDDFRRIDREMQRFAEWMQPLWFRPIFRASGRVRRLLSYDRWSFPWEFPWAALAGAVDEQPLKTVDVGAGGSPFPLYLAEKGHASFVADPSLIHGHSLHFSPQKGFRWNAQRLTLWLLSRLGRVTSEWGVPARRFHVPVNYLPYSAADLRFPDHSFDRVFCLSVIELIPRHLWARCFAEFERVLKPGGRLVMIFSMTADEADRCEYLRLVEMCNLKLLGDPSYPTPIPQRDKERRHPGHGYEPIGLVWQA